MPKGPSRKSKRRSQPPEAPPATPPLPPLPVPPPQADFLPGTDSLADVIFHKVMAKVNEALGSAGQLPSSGAPQTSTTSQLHICTSAPTSSSFPQLLLMFQPPAAGVASTTGVVPGAESTITQGVTQPTSSAAAANNAILNLLGESPNAPPNPSVYTLSSPLGIYVPLRLKERIWAGQFVDLALLLPGNVSLEDDEVDAKKAKDKKIMPLTMPQLVSAFHVLIAIRTERHPHDAPGMLKHLDTVQEIHKMFGAEAAVFYDHNVRLAQHHNLSLQWGHLNMELYMQATAIGLKSAHQSRASFQTKPPNQKWLKPGTCYFFFNQGGSALTNNANTQIRIIAITAKAPIPPTNAQTTIRTHPLCSPFAAGEQGVPKSPSNVPNQPLPKTKIDLALQDIVTPINSSVLSIWLTGYPLCDVQYLIDGFSHGFSLMFKGTPFSSFSPNHPSARNNHTTLSELIAKELSLGRIAGPFSSPPLHPFVVSPLGLVPKKGSDKFRVIHDLSFPTNASVNSGINPLDATVSYETLDNVIQLVQLLGAGALISKVDIEAAFRIIPVKPCDRYLLGFSMQGAYYFDKCLPMGCRTSCAIFERFSCALQWIARNKLHIRYTTHILDDFIFLGPPGSNMTRQALSSFLDFCQQCNIPIKKEKTVLPSSCVTCHGIEVDTLRMQARLPKDKLDRARALLLNLRNKRRVKLKELQSLLGFLNFACKVVVPGRPFLRRLINLTIGITKPHYHIPLCVQAKADIEAWLIFLTTFNGISLFLEPDLQDSDHLKLFTDASGSIGFAAVFGHHWFADEWPPAWNNHHITFKEMFPITLILEIWGPLLSRKRILLHSDNAAVVQIVNKQTCKDADTMSLVRRLVVAALKFNIQFKAKHIPGFTNVVADHLSRFSFQEARAVAPWLSNVPTPIPRHLMSFSELPGGRATDFVRSCSQLTGSVPPSCY